jgi:hypothetical protein
MTCFVVSRSLISISWLPTVITARFSAIFGSEQVQDTRAGHDAATAAIEAQTARMSAVRSLLDLLQASFSMQQAEYMNLQRTSKQLDRALTKYFQHLESHMHVIEATYRCG